MHRSDHVTHVFISYVRENSILVGKLATALRSCGVKVWLDRNDINPGQRWQDAIRDAIKSGDFFIACFSKEYFARRRSYMNEELTVAIDELRTIPTDQTWFIPVVLDETDPPARRISASECLNALQYVRLSDNWDDGIFRILKALGAEDPLRVRIRRLIEDLSLPSAADRQHAAVELGNIGRATGQAADILAGLLNDPKSKVRKSAAEALGKIGISSGVVGPAIAAALSDPSTGVRVTATRALGVMDPLPLEAVPALVAVIDRFLSGVSASVDASRRGYTYDPPDYWTPAAAVEALGRMGATAASATSVLSAALVGDDRYIAALSARAIGGIGPLAVEAVPALSAALNDQSVNNERVQAAAAEALGRIGPGAVKAVSSLAHALEDHDRDVQEAAARALGAIGPLAVEAIPSLVRTLHEYDQQLRETAALALEKIGKPLSEIVPALIQELEHPELDALHTEISTICGAARALGTIGLPATTAIPVLEERLENVEDHARETLADALRRIHAGGMVER
jgi:HEAT repeat protein